MNRSRAEKGETSPAKDRILKAAFASFRENGVAGATMLDIATRAHVSKRDLYALFDNKAAMLTACIRERTEKMRRPLQFSDTPPSAEAVSRTLIAFGTTLLEQVCQPDILDIYRLAIAEAERIPEVAQTLDAAGRQGNHAALVEWLTKVQALGLIPAGDPAASTALYFSTLWGDLLVRLLLRVCDAPSREQMQARATNAAKAVLGR